MVHNKYNKSPLVVDSLTLTPSSPRWVGAWWIGFLLSGLLAFLVAFPMCGFPTKLPGMYRCYTGLHRCVQVCASVYRCHRQVFSGVV